MSDDISRQGRVAGVLLIATTILGLAVMLHHPVGGGGSAAEQAGSLARAAGMARAVHGAMIGFVLTTLYALIVFARLRGLDRPLVLAGLVVYSAGVITMLTPPMFDGFVLPDLAVRAQHGGDALLAFPELMRFGFSIAIAFAKLAVVLMSAGVLLWSIELLRHAGARRWVGLLGLPTAAIPIGTMLFKLMPLNAHGMTIVLALWSLWYLAVGVLMARERA